MKNSQNKPYNTLRVGYFISPPGGALIPRSVQDHELFVEMITEGRVYAPDGENLCGPGWIFAHRSGEHTIYRSPETEHYECFTVAFEGADLRRFQSWPRTFQWRDGEEAVRFAREMLFAFHHTSVDRGVLGDLISAQLRFRLDQHQREQHREQIPPRIHAVMQEIDQHYAKPLRLADLAERVDMSVSHLQAEFKKHVHLSPHQYLIQQRMKAARHRLVTLQEPIKVVASEVGYTNPENFCRAFKKNTGHTADAFRQRYRVYM